MSPDRLRPITILALALALITTAVQAQPCEPCDSDCDGYWATPLDIVEFFDLMAAPPGSGCSPCAGDLNGDGLVTFQDIQPWLSLEECSFVDCNGNGLNDLVELMNSPWLDANSNMILDICEPVCVGPGCGACCLSETECLEYSSATDCLARGGYYIGDGEVCPRQATTVDYPEPSGQVFTHTINATADCPTRGRSRDCIEGELIDPWKSMANAIMCQNFGVTGSPAIPAGYFGPGSDPFDNPICLEGVPLGPTQWGDFGDADTLIHRAADPFDRCFLPVSPPEEAMVDIEIAALSLRGVDPITVTYNGGQDPEFWDTTVDLSVVHTDGDPGNDPPIGTLTATKTHCNGGTYTSILYVHARFTFTKVDDPAENRVLDTGLEPGFDPVALDATTPNEWVQDVHQNLGLTNPVCTSFHPGVEEFVELIPCDCNGNDVQDKCDVDPEDPDGDGFVSDDCNVNGVPDICDIDPTDPDWNYHASADCNTNGTPDECELVGNDCDADGTPDECEPDCNTNGTPDDCDTFNDCNTNGVPDECEEDCNGNLVPDLCDVDPGDPDGNGEVSQDCQPNGVPDECEGGDCNGNGVLDECDLFYGTSDDCNANGLPDECDMTSLTGLGTLGGTEGYATLINQKGQVAGMAMTPTLEYHAFLWEDGMMTDLGTLGGTFSDAIALNELGQVAGTSQNGASQDRVFLWLPEPDYGLPAGMNDLGTLGGSYSAGVDINEAGQVVGDSEVAPGAAHAFLWENGAMTDLDTLGGNYSNALSINELGQVVGESETADPGEYNAFLWLPVEAYGLTAGMNNLGTLGGSSSFAMALNDLGQVVGESETAALDTHAFLWLPEPAYGLPAGMNDLGALGHPFSSATGINETGQIIGELQEPPGFQQAFLWENGVMTDLGTLGGTYSAAWRINELGQVVGEAETSGLVFLAVLWENGEIVNLNHELPFGSEWELWAAAAINDTGWIAGNGSTGLDIEGFFLTLGTVTEDCNENGIPDVCDVDPLDPDGNGEISDDCNANGIPDECDIDCNFNLIPDDCEYPGCGGLMLGDMDCSGTVDLGDLRLFIHYLLAGTISCQADMNLDGMVNGHDIPEFIAVIVP